MVPDGAHIEASSARTTYDGAEARALLSDVGVVAMMTTLFGAETVTRLRAHLSPGCLTPVSSCAESLLEPGADLYAIGPAARRDALDGGHGAPPAKGGQLVLTASQGPEGTLLLTTATETETVRSERGSMIMAIVLSIGGLLLAFAGVRSC